MKFAAYVAVSFITFFHALLVPFFIVVYVCIYIYIYIYMLLFNFVNYLFYCYISVFLLLCMFRVFCFIVLFCVMFVCKCVLYYCHRVSTQSQVTQFIVSYHTNKLTIRNNQVIETYKAISSFSSGNRGGWHVYVNVVTLPRKLLK